MKTVNYEPLSPILFLKRSAIAFKNKIAVVDNNKEKTYAEFFNDCLTIAKGFNKIGAKEGDRIAYICPNIYPMLQAFYSVPMCGGILVPLNIRLTFNDISYILQHAGCKFLVVEESFFNLSYLNYVERIIIANSSCPSYTEDRILTYEQLIELGTQNDNFTEYTLNDENSTITINYTSGTTDIPKGVEYSYRSVYLNAVGECLQSSLNMHSSYLWVLPMFHCNGWCFTWAVTAVGAKHVCLESFNPEKIISLIIEQQITHFCAAPTVLNLLLNSKEFPKLSSYNNLRIIMAGSSSSAKIIEAYEKTGINITHVYGLTETHGPHTICQEQPNWRFLSKKQIAYMKTFQGLPGIHATFLRVVNTDLQDIPHDGKTLGEIIMRGNNVMKGYYKNEKETEKVFKNGWFHSGDLAVITKDGYIDIKDRAKDIIISGGENISSIEVEAVIYEHPAVLLVAVIPTYDAIWGEIVHAFVELKKSNSIDESELIKFCKGRIASYKCPKKVTFIKLPVTSTGKIQKSLLKKQYYFADRVNI